MKTKHKIEAFTLSEMVVVLILTSLVVGMAFSVLTMVQKHMNGIQDNLNKNTELHKLEQSLWLDFNRYSKISYSPFDDELVFSSELTSISYKFNTETITKDLDTFKVSVENKAFFFDGNAIQEGHLDALKLNMSKNFRNQVLFIFKKNDATQFME